MKNVVLIVVAIAVLAFIVWWGGALDIANPSPAGSENAAAEVPAFTPAVAETPLPESDIPGAALRVFDVALTRNGVSPSSITVGEGDRVQLNVKASDALYDFVVEIPRFEFYLNAIAEGVVRPVSFSVPTPGMFVFGCRQRCPTGSRLTAQLIVLDR